MSKRFLFLDIEASGLDEGTYPIELGWTTEEGQTSSFLIHPTQDWLENGIWDSGSEDIHGISLAELMKDGVSVHEAHRQFMAAAKGKIVMVTSIPYDGYWLGRLFEAIGFDMNDFWLHDYDSEMLEQYLKKQNGVLPQNVEHFKAARFYGEMPPAHRAGEDSRQMLEIWNRVLNRS